MALLHSSLAGACEMVHCLSLATGSSRMLMSVQVTWQRWKERAMATVLSDGSIRRWESGSTKRREHQEWLRTKAGLIVAMAFLLPPAPESPWFLASSWAIEGSHGQEHHWVLERLCSPACSSLAARLTVTPAFVFPTHTKEQIRAVQSCVHPCRRQVCMANQLCSLGEQQLFILTLGSYSPGCTQIQFVA